MQKMHVIGLLMLVFGSAHAWADDAAAEAKPEPVQAKAEKKVEAKEVDELEKVLQSAYDYNDQQQELGSASDM
jgi:hypothetical protein